MCDLLVAGFALQAKAEGNKRIIENNKKQTMENCRKDLVFIANEMMNHLFVLDNVSENVADYGMVGAHHLSKAYGNVEDAINSLVRAYRQIYDRDLSEDVSEI